MLDFLGGGLALSFPFGKTHGGDIGETLFCHHKCQPRNSVLPGVAGLVRTAGAWDSSVGDSNSDEREQVCLSFLPFEL